MVEMLTNKEFHVGQEFPDIDALKAAIDEFASQNCFVACKNAYNDIRCSNFRPNNGKNNQTGCPYNIKYSKSKKHKRVTITSIQGRHNHELNDLSYEVTQRKTGKATKMAIDLVSHALQPLLLQQRPPECQQVRDIIKFYVEDNVTLGWQTVQNITRAARERMRRGEILPPPKLDKRTIKEFERLSSIKKDMKTGDAMNVLTEISSNTSYKTSWIMEKLMERLEKEGGGFFSYRMHYDKSGLVNGVIWMTGHGRAALSLHGKVAFFDMRVSERS